MKHLLFIDPLEKLTIKKDSTLLLAHTLKQAGKEVYLLFEKDFYFSNSGLMSFEVYDQYGQIIMKGYNNKVEMDGLQKGMYYINYDNTFAEVTR